MSDSIVIIPTFNEKENVELIIETVFSLQQPFDILIVDDNSPDGTAAIVESLQLKYNTTSTRLHLMKRAGKQGLGTAYIAGFHYALENGFEYILEMDADFSHDPKDLVQLRKKCIEEKADMSIGSRYATGVNVVNWPMGRVLMSYFASFYVRVVTGMTIRDTTAGFVCFHRKVLQTIPIDEVKFIGYAFQISGRLSPSPFGPSDSGRCGWPGCSSPTAWPT